ncbi:hypothetical protein BCD49_33835 [Pseudofrankia sp. EUN1h]|nr:LLM class flavin-dependent oxidoreductase [Pseudofrankia sp. EUN1h]OHV30431.1 hypothetical protein BCD49_33835 [Pseudofrankia sp. EUN1h]
MPVQTRHPVAMAQQVLSTQTVYEGRFTLGMGASHHWIVEEQLGLPYGRPAHLVRSYLEVLNAAFAGPGRIDVDNDICRVHSPLDVTDLAPTPILVAALAPMMLHISCEHASGTFCGWRTRAIGDHMVPRVTKAASDAGRPAPRIVAGVPVALCSANEVNAARGSANTTLGHAEHSPNYLRLLQHGDAGDVGDLHGGRGRRHSSRRSAQNSEPKLWAGRSSPSKSRHQSDQPKEQHLAVVGRVWTYDSPARRARSEPGDAALRPLAATGKHLAESAKTATAMAPMMSRQISW